MKPVWVVFLFSILFCFVYFTSCAQSRNTLVLHFYNHKKTCKLVTCDDPHRCHARYCWPSYGTARPNLAEVKPYRSGEQMAQDSFIPSPTILLGANVLLTSGNTLTCLNRHSITGATRTTTPSPATSETQGLAITQSLQLSQESVSPPPASLRSLPPSYLFPPTTPPQSAFQHDKPHGISAVL